MRQSGIIACFGIYSLDHMINQLKADHDNAQLIANALCKSDYIIIDPKKVKTNLIYFKLSNLSIDKDQFIKNCKKLGVLFYYIGNDKYRLVTHYGIDKEDAQNAVDIICKVLNLLEEK